MATDLMFNLIMNRPAGWESQKLPPEKMSSVQTSRERINRAIALFQANFDDDGKPITKHGLKLVKKYYWEESDKDGYGHLEAESGPQSPDETRKR